MFSIGTITNSVASDNNEASASPTNCNCKQPGLVALADEVKQEDAEDQKAAMQDGVFIMDECK